jgi:DNA repair protein RadC
MTASIPPIYRITDLAADERPRERLAHLGLQTLSNAKLLAILLRVGVPGEEAVQVGHRLLRREGGEIAGCGCAGSHGDRAEPVGIAGGARVGVLIGTYPEIHHDGHNVHDGNEKCV